MGYDPATGNLFNTITDVGGAGRFNATRRFSYNNVGQLLTAVDPLQTLTRFSYDAFGNLISVIRDCCGAGHLNQTTTFAYNAFGDVISSTNPNRKGSEGAPCKSRTPARGALGAGSSGGADALSGPRASGRHPH